MRSAVNKILNPLVLTIYVTINLVSVFHFHHVEFSKGCLSIVNDSSNSAPSDPFLGSDSKCLLHQFFQISYLDSSIKNSTGNTLLSEFQFYDFTSNHFCAFEGWASNLRAPPLSF